MEKVIVFQTYELDIFDNEIINGYQETKEAIDNNKNTIRTTQMCLLSTKLFDKGYEIWVKDPKQMYEIKLGNCDRTDREIRKAHNIFKLWQAGAFD